MAEDAAEPEIVLNEAEERWETRVDGKTGIVTYSVDGDRLYILHTEVDPEIGGRGIAARLVTAALDYAREKGLRVVPFCPYARVYVHRHKEYQDLLASTD